jgi:hypothetical protein
VTHNQQTRLLTLSHECAMLMIELQTDRSRADTGEEKARLRAVGNHLEKANKDLQAAVDRMRR